MLYSRGDRSKKGNLNTRMVLDEAENQFYLEIANPLLKKEKGKKNSPRLRFKVYIPDKYFEEIIQNRSTKRFRNNAERKSNRGISSIFD